MLTFNHFVDRKFWKTDTIGLANPTWDGCPPQARVAGNRDKIQNWIQDQTGL